MRNALLIGLVTALLAAGCGNKSDPSPAADPGKGKESTTGKPPAGATPPAGGGLGDYSLAAIKTIPDGCATPSVLLATAPSSVGSAYAWHITRQAFLANQQIHVVQGDPTAPGEVHLAPYAYGASSYALVGTCKDGATCNHVAAMYKAIVRSSNPQLTCGKVQGIGASPVGTFAWSADPKQNLPPESEAIALCARISACQIATDRSTPGDPLLECQKAPVKFKTSCAARYPCAEVLACMSK